MYLQVPRPRTQYRHAAVQTAEVDTFSSQVQPPRQWTDAERVFARRKYEGKCSTLDTCRPPRTSPILRDVAGSSYCSQAATRQHLDATIRPSTPDRRPPLNQPRWCCSSGPDHLCWIRRLKRVGHLSQLLSGLSFKSPCYGCSDLSNSSCHFN